MIGPERAIGCVVYPAAEVPEPGVIRHESGDRFVRRRALGREHASASSASPSS